MHLALHLPQLVVRLRLRARAHDRARVLRLGLGLGLRLRLRRLLLLLLRMCVSRVPHRVGLGLLRARLLKLELLELRL